jgi:hypothetical protein
MIPRIEEVIAAHLNFARFRRIDPRRDETLIADALRLASELARGRPGDEPAAMLFALTRRWNALGAAWEHFPVVCAKNLAVQVLGARLDARLDDVDLGMLRLRVVTGDAPFEEVRAWVAAHLRPL